MKINTELGKVAESIASSFKERAKEVNRIINDTKNMREQFKKENKNMAENLKSTFKNLHKEMADREKERISGFNSMMGNIQKEITESAAMIQDLLSTSKKQRIESEKDRLKKFGDFYSELRQSVEEAKEARKDLIKGEKVRISNFNKFISEIRDDIARSVSDVQSLLISSKKSRINGEKDRIKEYDSFISDIQKVVSENSKIAREMQAEAAKLISNLASTRKLGVEEWKSLMNSAKQGKTPTPKAMQKKEKKVAIKKNIKAKKEEEKPKQNEPEIFEPSNSKESLYVQIIKLTEQHAQDGIKVGEMETAIGVSKLKLGKIAKELADEGKIRNVEGRYFPPVDYYSK